MENKKLEAFALDDESMEDVLGGLRFVSIKSVPTDRLEELMSWFFRNPQQSKHHQDDIKKIRTELNNRKFYLV